jgi:hypothetical protein
MSVPIVGVTALSYPADLPQLFQQRSETYARTREWLPSCVLMIRVGPLFFGDTYGGYGRIYNVGMPGKQHKGMALTRSSLCRHATYPEGGGVSMSGKEDGRNGRSDTIWRR